MCCHIFCQHSFPECVCATLFNEGHICSSVPQRITSHWQHNKNLQLTACRFIRLSRALSVVVPFMCFFTLREQCVTDEVRLSCFCVLCHVVVYKHVTLFYCDVTSQSGQQHLQPNVDFSSVNSSDQHLGW